ncbi:hypothetical protein [Pacificoceanicola onchidii]|uniref:hypothetical protein n=1 Tax=Pacificoceanicola onchidii TaxID=2562685 RepID=UPI0010A52FA3|nr:hypothetical protein [Pacificoceanicola onchidii]
MMQLTESFLEERREALRARVAPKVNGIDRVEVDAGSRKVSVHFVHPMPGQPGGVPAAPALNKNRFSIIGGDSIRDVKVLSTTITDPHTIALTVASLGDFSAYTMQVDHPGMDPILREMRFGFRNECFSDFDCKTADLEVISAPPEDGMDHMAKDYDSFRQTMLDRIARSAPDFAMGDVADTGMALVEVLALWADHLSYAQDAAASEAYLSTARRRASVRRHAQLLGYEVHDGLSARSFVQVQTAESGVWTRDQLLFMTRNEAVSGSALSASEVNFGAALAAGVQFFEPLPVMHPDFPGDPHTTWSEQPFRLDPGFNSMVLHDWGDPRAVLPKGATEAWVHRPAHGQPLKAGDFLSLELQRDPVTRRVADADRSMRQIVCLAEDPIPEVDSVANPVQPLYRLRWHSDDALRFDLPVGTVDNLAGLDAGPAVMALCFGNLVPVDHGLSVPDGEDLPLPDPDPNDDPEAADSITALSDLDRSRRYAPVLRHRDISVGAELRQDTGLGMAASEVLSAKGTRGARKAIWLLEGRTGQDQKRWDALNTLLFAGENDRVFVPETEQDGTTTLRFGGKDKGGMRPLADPLRRLTAHYRIGVGRPGNIGADAIAHVILSGAPGPSAARNPIGGTGGRDRETVPEIRAGALAQLDDNRRAVIRQDWVRLAEEHPQVSRAHVRSTFHGSWDVFHVAIDPVGGVEVSDALLEDVTKWLERFRLMGQDFVVERPRFAPLEIEISLCVCKDFRVSDVRAAVLDRLGAGLRADGRQGFFHPDRMSFGAPVYLSPLIAEIRAVPGVSDVEMTAFRRWRGEGRATLEAGVIEVEPDEIPILMNDPSYPERGVLRIREWSAA